MTGNRIIYEKPELEVLGIQINNPIMGDSISVEPWQPGEIISGDAE